jgi:hypothetical protein
VCGRRRRGRRGKEGSNRERGREVEEKGDGGGRREEGGR